MTGELSAEGSAATRDATERQELLEAMLAPSFYPHAPSSVELRETHISWVFLAGDRAYKVKKPIVFPFLDYGTLPRRHEMCREEIRLNRRLAPQIYLGVVGIAGSEGRYRLTSEDDPAAIEYAVEMRRVEEDRNLAVLASRGELEPTQVEALARRLARFHAEAPAAPAELRAVDVLVATLEENHATLREAGAGILGEERLEAAEGFTRGFLAARREQLEARARAGLVRDCHGDLRAEHVIVPEREPLYVYDCVEFNPELRQIDVAADLAFLVMDLARLGAEGAALQLIDGYRRAGGEAGDDPLLFFFASYRAWVRAKVAALRALELDEQDAERRTREVEARELLGLGHRFAWRARGPLLLIVCGVAGAGKTTLARRLAELSGWAHIASDVTRKRLAGIAPTERAGGEQYSGEMTTRTYGAMGRAAREELERRGGAIVDATFHRRSERAAFEDGLAEQSVPRLLVECKAPPEVLLRRARERELERDRVSDAGAAVVQRQLDELEPYAEVPASARMELLTEAPPDELAAEVEAFVDTVASFWRHAS
jgi:aminoglycoside phosphotransferase family enzyme/predicted kinase